MTERVAELVLKDTYEQTETLTMAEANAASMLDVHARLMQRLEGAGILDRELEALPDKEAIDARRHEHRGLTRPELSVVLAHSKIQLYSELLDSDVPEDPYLSAELEAYFPEPLPERFRDRMREHRLWREIIATQVVNNVLHGGGSTFTFRIGEETGATASQIARAYSAAREIFDMRSQWGQIEALDNAVSAETQAAMLLDGRRLLERGTRWLLRNRRRPLAISETVDYFKPGAATLYESVARLLAPADAEPLAARADELREAGVPVELAAHVASLATMFSAFDIVEVSRETNLDVESVAAVYFCLGSELQLHWIRDRIVGLPRSERWAALARAALRDDLYSLHRALTQDVLGDDDAPADVEACVAEWIAANPAAERYIATLADVRIGRVYDLTTLPVVVRELRNLLQTRSGSGVHR
jgi:glutamate dehydrogenase